MNRQPSTAAVPARKGLQVALGILLVGVAAVFWMLRDRGTAPLDVAPARAARSGVGPPAAAAGAPEAPAEVADANPVREVVVADVPRPAADGRVRVRVVRDGDTPVAGATVITMAPDFRFDRLAPDLERRLQRAHGTWDRLEVVGVPTVADRDGIAIVPRPTQWSEALGRADGLFGWCSLEGQEPDGGFVLRLVADSTLRVRVRAADGSPVTDLPVGLAATYKKPGAESGDAEVFAVATTDADGEAAVKHLQLRRTDDWGAVAEQARIVPFAPGLIDGGVDIDLSAPPADGIDLVLPPVGSLRVLLRDRDGAPLSDDNLRLDDLASPGPTFFAAARDGVARYAVVGLGRQFHAQSRLDARTLRGAGPGPVRAGEEAELVLQLPAAGVTLRGRAVGADGRALADGWLGIEGAALAKSSPDSVRTDDEGRFLLLLDAPAVGASLDVVLRWQPRSGNSIRFRGEQARLEGIPLVAGTTQLGDVVFHRAPVLVTGRVFGVDPLPALHVQVARQSRDGKWDWANDIAVDLRADGAFEVLGQITPGQFARHLLQFVAEGCAPVAPLEFVGGERDVQVELRREARLEARVLVDASVLQHPEVLVFETLLPAAHIWLPCQAEVDADGLVLRLTGLPAGPLSFRARLLGVPEPLVTFGELPLRGGETLRDPRLQAIDLRSVHAVRLRLVDERGAARDVGGQWVPTRPDRVDDEGAGIDHGVTWVGCSDAFDVLLFPEGLRPTRARGPARDLDVRAEAELAIALHIDGLPRPPVGCAFAVVAKPLSRGVVGEFAAETVFALDRQYPCDADGKVRLRVVEPGLVELRVVAQGGIGAIRAAEVSVTKLRFLADGEHRLVVATEAVARALAELGFGR